LDSQGCVTFSVSAFASGLQLCGTEPGTTFILPIPLAEVSNQ
jgi:hypothetical protein